jgi:integrase
MSVRKRKWLTKTGEVREAWVAEVGSAGDRHIKTFATKGEAKAYEAEARVDLRAGVHTNPSKSPTVAKAAADWLAASEARGLERTTLKTYREHCRVHIVPFLGEVKLSDLNAPVVRAFETKLRATGRSPATTKMVITSLGAIIAEAVEHGKASKNPVRDLRRHRRQKGDREKAHLEAGVDIPTPAEVGKIIAAASGRTHALLVVAAFTGLRASELRGLTWSNVDLNANLLKVTQRADHFNQIGAPKSVKSRRTVPFGSFVANTLKEWKLACPPNELDLVFPTANGHIMHHTNLIQRDLIPVVAAALGEPKYTGMHCLRHFYASWCIDRGLAPKVVQERMGHSSITITYDRYGHLFPRDDDSAEIDAAELSVVRAT